MNFTVTFNITPPDSAVSYSIDNEKYDQTTTGNGSVKVTHGSTLYYKLNKEGYDEIVESLTVNKNETITKNLVKSNFTITFNITPSDSTLKVNDTQISGNTYTAEFDSTINWEVSKESYDTKRGEHRVKL